MDGKLGTDLEHLPPLYTEDGGHGMIFRAGDGLRLTFHSPNASGEEHPVFVELADRGERLEVLYGFACKFESHLLSRKEKERMKKKISLFLACLLALSAVLAGCSETKEQTSPAETQASAAADPATGASDGDGAGEEYGFLHDDLPADLDFEGETITIHIRNGDNGNPQGNCVMEMTVEELNGELLNDAIYNRNIAVNERLNVKIDPYVSYDWTRYGDARDEIRASIKANEDRFDIIAGWCNGEIPAMALENCFLDLKGAPYLDTEKPWWNQALVKTNPFAGQLFFLTGESNILTSLGSAFTVFVNEAIETDYQLTPLSTYVDEGTWTIDKMGEIAEQIYVDLNGNGKKDADTDRFGLVLLNYIAADAFYTSLDCHQIEIDENGGVTYVPQAERIHSAIEKVYNLHYVNEGSLGWLPDITRGIFLESRSLMTLEFMEAAREEFREMEDSYYIIPMPKLDEAQEKYRSYIFNNLTVLSVPVTNLNTDASYATMEALSSESYFNVTPVFFNVCMQNKYARSETTSRMLEIIRESCYVDYEYIYGSLFYKPAFIFRDLIGDKSSDSASWIARNTKVIQKQIEKALKKLGE